MGFHEERFPPALSFGSMGGPERRTDIVALANGFEERNTPWAHSRRRYDAGVGMRSLDDVTNLVTFFEARRGQLHGFRWKDWTDYKSCTATADVDAMDQVIGTGDGGTDEFDLSKTYLSGGESYTRPITKPVAGTVKVAVRGVAQAHGVDFAVDYVTGTVTLMSPPAVGEQVTAGFEFDVPVRFDTDTVQASVASFQAGEVPSVPVVEVRV